MKASTPVQRLLLRLGILREVGRAPDPVAEQRRRRRYRHLGLAALGAWALFWGIQIARYTVAYVDAERSIAAARAADLPAGVTTSMPDLHAIEAARYLPELEEARTNQLWNIAKALLWLAAGGLLGFGVLRLALRLRARWIERERLEEPGVTVVACPSCGCNCRVRSGRNISVTCPRCGHLSRHDLRPVDPTRVLRRSP